MIFNSQKVTICLVKGAVVSKRIRNIALAKQEDKLSAPRRIQQEILRRVNV